MPSPPSPAASPENHNAHANQRTASRHLTRGRRPEQQPFLHQDARTASGEEDRQFRRARRLSPLLRRRDRRSRLGDDLFPLSRHRAGAAGHGRGRRNGLLGSRRRDSFLEGALREARRRRPVGGYRVRREAAAFRRRRRRQLRAGRNLIRRPRALAGRRDRRRRRDPRLPLGFAQAARRRRDRRAARVHGL